MNQEKIEKELRFLKIYAISTTLIFALLLALIFAIVRTKKFSEIDVERINVVEKDGRIKMVISNQSRQHPGTMDGVTYYERQGQRPSGIIFFGENGNEIGGLVFEGKVGRGQGGSLTFDKFRGDQTLQFVHEEDEKENYFAGLKMNDQNMPLTDLINKQNEIERLPTEKAKDSAYLQLREKGLLMTERLKIGRDYDKSAVIRLKDAKGHVRIELKVEASGTSTLNFLDGAGRVTYSFPNGTNPRAY